uniref:Uncharacterized protein n=1 Tax=Setaria italica TaxID=4555 RepID=K3YNW0_SETIT
MQCRGCGSSPTGQGFFTIHTDCNTVACDFLGYFLMSKLMPHACI